MRNESNTQRRRRGIFLLICFLLPGISSQFAAAQALVQRDAVGKVTGMASTATQNGVRSNLQDMVRAHDTLITDNSGRLRLQLLSGTILNVGSGSQLQILNYDPVSQATTVELKAGRLRSRVARLPSATGAFEILTPYAKVTALGGDFSVEVDPSHTRVLVHSGVVVMASAPSDPAAKLALDLVAGQTAISDARGIGALELTPDDLEQQSLTATLVPDTPPSAPVSVAVTEAPITKPRSHLQRNLLIGLVIAGGGAAAAVLAGHGGGGSSSTTQPPPSIPTIPGH
jgi:hypothetical protein